MKSYFAAKYLTDCNTDGIYEAGESPSTKYNMHILTSGTTFSCANVLAYYASHISSDLELGRSPEGGESIDDGVPVDINLEYEDFYSIDAIRAAIAG